MLRRIATRLHREICQRSRHFAAQDLGGKKKNGSSSLQFLRGISEIRFEYHDLVWLRLWQSVANVPFRQSVLPIVQEYLQTYNVEKKHLLNIIYKLRINAKFAQGVEICEWMIHDKPFPVEESDYILRMELVGRISKYRATHLFWEMPVEMRSEAAYTEILRIFARWHAVPAAEDTLSEMKSLSLITSVAPYNIMMDMYKRKNADDKIRASYNELTALGIAPDIQTYLIVLRAKQKIGGFEGIEDEARRFLAQELKKDQLVFVYECMVRIYALLGDLEAVERIWKVLKRKGLKVSTSSYGCMLDAYRQLGEVERAERLFEELGNHFTPLTRQYRDMIAVYSEHQRMDKAEELYKQLFRAGLECHPTIYHSMICGYIKADEKEKALVAYGKARDRSLLGHPKPLRATLLVVMKMVSDEGDFRTGEKLLEELESDRQAGDVDIYNLLLRAYIKAEVPVVGFDGRMLKNGVMPNAESLELLKQINLDPKKKKKRVS